MDMLGCLLRNFSGFRSVSKRLAEGLTGDKVSFWSQKFVQGLIVIYSYYITALFCGEFHKVVCACRNSREMLGL